MLKAALALLGCLMVAVTLLPLSRSDAWWVRIWDFPRIQIACLLAAVLLAWAVFVWTGTPGDYLFVAALVASLAFQCASMFPYTRLHRRQVEPSARSRAEADLVLVFGNVLMTNRRADGLREIIRREDPDVFLAVEADEWWREQLSEFERTHPHTVLQPQDNTYGMLLYSRLELIEPRLEFLIQDDVPSIHTRVRLRSGHEVELHCLHPRPPFPSEDERSTERDAELIVVGKAVKGRQTPVVLMGDLNDVAWSRTNKLLQKISGLLDPRVGRGFYNTFHASFPFIRFPLDHFFHSKHFRIADFRRLPSFGSDHFPVLVALSHEPDAAAHHEELHPDASERAEAEEKIEKAIST
jgi:endonuclease/exonuclease/phosphatase (EEP) superfamily protein YafD